jgi:hypothetical protein
MNRTTPTSPSLEDRLGNPVNPRWRKLLKNSYFRAPVDLPPSARRRQRLASGSGSGAASALEEQRLQQRWEGTTPQGREIIRKNLFELKRTLRAAKKETQIEILRRLVPIYVSLVAARKGSPAAWKTCCAAAVEGLIRAGHAEAWLETEKELSAVYAQQAWRPQGTEQAGEVDCWQALAVEVKKRLMGPFPLSPLNK